MISANPDIWDEQISRLPNAHVLQTREWGEFKSQFGWQVMPRVWQNADGQVQAAALVLRRSIPAGGFAARMSVMYIPRGPLLDWQDPSLVRRVLDDLQQLARSQGAIFIKMDPEVVTGRGVPGSPDAVDEPGGLSVISELARRGWFFSPDQIQFRNTVWLDLTGSEEDWLARMKQKTRYNLRLAQKKGVTTRAGSLADLPLLYRMYAETSVRDGFVIRDETYYRRLWSLFLQRGMAQPIIAEVGGEPAGAVVLFHFAGRAWYLFGMSREAHREKMPNYLLQWEAMRLAKSLGCNRYDLWGAPDEFTETDSLWGVYRFKEGLGGEVIRTLGAWDFTTRLWLYRLYTRALPRLLDVLRQRGKARTRQSVSL